MGTPTGRETDGSAVRLPGKFSRFRCLREKAANPGAAVLLQVQTAARLDTFRIAHGYLSASVERRRSARGRRRPTLDLMLYTPRHGARQFERGFLFCGLQEVETRQLDQEWPRLFGSQLDLQHLVRLVRRHLLHKFRG